MLNNREKSQDHQKMRFLRLRRLWWKIRYHNSTCDVRYKNTAKKFYYDSPKLHSLLQNHYNESHILDLFLSELKTGDVVWDIGADQGLFGVLASERVGTDGMVCAFEPDDVSIKKLKKNIRINSVENMKIFNLALGDFHGEGNIERNPIYNSSSIVSKMETGDRLVENGTAPMPNVIKMDIEGAEWKALKGMETILADNKCRFVIVEIHPKLLRNKTPEDIEDFFSQSNFIVSDRYVRGAEEHWAVRKVFE